MSTSSICELSQVLRGSLGIVDEYTGSHLTQSEHREIAWLTEQCAQASDTWCRQHQSYKEGGVAHYPDFLNDLERSGHLRNIDERQGSRGSDDDEDDQEKYEEKTRLKSVATDVNNAVLFGPSSLARADCLLLQIEVFSTCLSVIGRRYRKDKLSGDLCLVYKGGGAVRLHSFSIINELDPHVRATLRDLFAKSFQMSDLDFDVKLDTSSMSHENKARAESALAISIYAVLSWCRNFMTRDAANCERYLPLYVNDATTDYYVSGKPGIQAQFQEAIDASRLAHLKGGKVKRIAKGSCPDLVLGQGGAWEARGVLDHLLDLLEFERGSAEAARLAAVFPDGEQRVYCTIHSRLVLNRNEETVLLLGRLKNIYEIKMEQSGVDVVHTTKGEIVDIVHRIAHATERFLGHRLSFSSLPSVVGSYAFDTAPEVEFHSQSLFGVLVELFRMCLVETPNKKTAKRTRRLSYILTLFIMCHGNQNGSRGGGIDFNLARLRLLVRFTWQLFRLTRDEAWWLSALHNGDADFAARPAVLEAIQQRAAAASGEDLEHLGLQGSPQRAVDRLAQRSVKPLRKDKEHAVCYGLLNIVMQKCRKRYEASDSYGEDICRELARSVFKVLICIVTSVQLHPGVCMFQPCLLPIQELAHRQGYTHSSISMGEGGRRTRGATRRRRKMQL